MSLQSHIDRVKEKTHSNSCVTLAQTLSVTETLSPSLQPPHSPLGSRHRSVPLSLQSPGTFPPPLRACKVLPQTFAAAYCTVSSGPGSNVTALEGSLLTTQAEIVTLSLLTPQLCFTGLHCIYNHLTSC